MDGGGVENLKHEAGGHRVQRVPRTERNGRVHSSTVTVAVLGALTVSNSPYDRRSADDFSVEWYNGTIGAGGQNHQKTACCARITHIPTGIIRTAQTRSRNNSYKNAMEALQADLDRAAGHAAGRAENAVRKAHVGSGERSDRRRTYQFQNGLVRDHLTGKSAPVDRVMKGGFDLIW